MRTFAAVTLALVLAVAMVMHGCSRNPVGDDSPGPVERGTAAGLGVVFKGAPSEYGNCLSMPVIFAEGYGLTGADALQTTGLRGTPGVESFVEPYNTSTVIDGYLVYKNPSVNEWQADWATGASWIGEVPVELDWSDNLVRQTWSERSKVRVEVILTAPIDPAVLPLEGYNMYSLGGTQLQEVFVTNTTKYTATAATVYSNVARLTIEKLDGQGGLPVATVYNSACYDGYFLDGPTNAYSAEVNMSGKCIYGFNWDIGESPVEVKSGWYRLTFSLDAAAAYTDADGVTHSYPRNTVIAGLNPADIPGVSDPDVVVYPPKLSEDGFSSTLDIFVKAKNSGK